MHVTFLVMDPRIANFDCKTAYIWLEKQAATPEARLGKGKGFVGRTDGKHPECYVF